MINFCYLRALQLRRAANDAGGATPANAESTQTTDAGKADTDKTADEDKPSGEKAFTQADVDKLISQTIAKERARADKAVSAAKTEAEKLATMTAEQRAEHERQERENKLAAREAELSRRELRATALQTLAEKQLPAELAEVLDYTDADKCSASITSVEKTFRAAVQKGVEERLKGAAPAAGKATLSQSTPKTLQESVSAYYDKTKG